MTPAGVEFKDTSLSGRLLQLEKNIGQQRRISLKPTANPRNTGG
jgi:hypothetical protein